MKQAGWTPDNKPVVSGIYRFYETHGLPMADQIAFLWSDGSVPEWREILSEMVQAGMNPEKAKKMLISEAKDSGVEKFRGAGFEEKIGRLMVRNEAQGEH